MLRKWLIISPIVFCAMIFSGCSAFLSTLSDVAASPQEVLQKAFQAAEKVEGFRMNNDMRYDFSTSNNQTGFKEIKSNVELVDENNFSINIEGKQSVEGVTNIDKFDVYFQNGIMYLKDPFLPSWIRKSVSVDQAVQSLPAHPEQIQPTHILQNMQQEAEHVVMRQEGSEYVLQLNLTDSSRIQPFMVYQDKFFKDASGVDYRKLQVTLWIDSTTYQLKKAESNFSFHTNYDNGIEADATLKVTNEYTGSASTIQLPSDAY